MSAAMSDDRDAISKLIITYAERVDLGDFEGVGALFEHSTYRSALGDDVVTYTGSGDVQSDHGVDGDALRRRHAPHQARHDEPDDRRRRRRRQRDSSKCYFSVLQQVDDFPLQAIIAGRYHDRFERVAGEWRFADRLIFSDLIGDLSHHLTVDPYA